MNCRYCGTAFKLTKFHVEVSTCLDCSGITDDLSIDDEELKVEIWNLRNPTGKIKAIFEYDLETEDV